MSQETEKTKFLCVRVPEALHRKFRDIVDGRRERALDARRRQAESCQTYLLRAIERVVAGEQRRGGAAGGGP